MRSKMLRDVPPLRGKSSDSPSADLSPKTQKAQRALEESISQAEERLKGKPMPPYQATALQTHIQHLKSGLLMEEEVALYQQSGEDVAETPTLNPATASNSPIDTTSEHVVSHILFNGLRF